MKPLRVALVVPNKRTPDGDDTHQAKLLEKMCHAGEIDLVVHDEWFLYGPLDDWHATVGKYAEKLRTPVLSGYGANEGYITAAYVNPRPDPGDTAQHQYFKHSSADLLPYQRESYRGRDDSMFEPIRLAGHRIGVMVCHDMFFGLITARYLDHGATALFDLTGGDVKLGKWRTICQGRSVEVGGPFYCTMALGDGSKRGQAAAIAYCDGAEVQPLSSHTRPDGTGGFNIYPMTIGPLPGMKAEVHQKLSPRSDYRDIRVSLDGSGAAEIKIASQGGGVRIEGTKPLGVTEGWHGFGLPAGKVGVLAVPLDQLGDPRVLYRLRPPQGAFGHHVVVYHAPKAPADEEKALALLRLRAVEHRIAACALAGEYKEAIKTDNYKHIQRIPPRNDVFGLNARNLGGTHVTWSNAIPPEMFGQYLELL
jgi:predicted amidohydrolase